MKNEGWRYPGARWWKFDFHTHTPASTDWRQDSAGALTPRDWLLRFMGAGIDCVAITDHNSGAWVDVLKQAYAEMAAARPEGFRELVLFPGAELSVNGGFHILAIFDTVATSAWIERLLGKVGYEGERGSPDGATRKSAVEVVEAIVEAGGLAIPAHVDGEKGLLRLAKGHSAAGDAHTIRQVLECGRVWGMEVVDSRIPKPEIYTEAKCQWTEVLGSDCHSFREGSGPGSRFTWVKMGSPSLEGLRLALVDGARFSIRRSYDPEKGDPGGVPKHCLQSITIREARYMGRGHEETIEFSPWLSAVVGGRGTGKSTIVHAIRMAFRREEELKVLPEQNEARLVFERFQREPKGRNDATGALDYVGEKRTALVATVLRDGERYRLHWRQDGSGPAVESESDGGWTASQGQTVSGERFRIRIFSQGQIAALAGESREALLSLLDDAAGIGTKKAAMDEETRSYSKMRAALRELEARLKRLDGLEVELADIGRKLASFEGQQHTEVLQAFQRRTRQNREVQRQLEAVAAKAAALKKWAAELTPEDLPQGLFSTGSAVDGDAVALVGRLHAAITEASAVLSETAERLTGATERERLGMPTIQWFREVLDARREYTGLTERLKAQGIADPNEFGSLVQERQRLETEMERLRLFTTEQERVQEELEGQRARLFAARQAIRDGRQTFLDDRLAGNEYVKMSLRPYQPDERALEGQLRRVLGVEDDRFEEDIQRMVRDLLRPEEASEGWQSGMSSRVEKLRRRLEETALGRGGFGGHFNNYLKREVEKKPELLDRLLVWAPEDGLEVQYSPKGDGKEFRPIEQASAGQRAAAMLAFLLADGDEPLVLDQPEDDLDNHLIYELVVRQIRANKVRRQVIVVTHNANILVNGDAEMVHVMDFAGGQCRVMQRGSLQEEGIREEVCKVMEGGKEAFERRYRRLRGDGDV